MIRDYVRMIQRLLHRQMDQISFRTRHLNSSSSNSLNSNADRRKPPFDIHLNWTHYLLNKTTHTHSQTTTKFYAKRNQKKNYIHQQYIYIYTIFLRFHCCAHLYGIYFDKRPKINTHKTNLFNIKKYLQNKTKLINDFKC